MEDAGVSELFSVIAENLFGEQAFRDPRVARPIVKEELNRLVSTILAHIWNKLRKTIPTQYERLLARRGTARDTFNSTHYLLSHFAIAHRC